MSKLKASKIIMGCLKLAYHQEAQEKALSFTDTGLSIAYKNPQFFEGESRQKPESVKKIGVYYYSFGMQMPDRTFSVANGGYRFGFNGKEMDNEVSGQGNQYDYGFRIYNPRLGKFLSVDPLTQSYPWYTPYQFAGNKVIRFIDLDGLEEYDPMQEDDNTSALYTITGETVEEIFGYNKDQAVTYERDKKGNYQYTRVTYSRKHGKAIKTNIDPKSGLYGRSLQLGVKMFKDDELHHKLFKHFLIAKGGEYLLSPKEVNGMPMQPFDLSGMVMTVADRENADAKINMNTTVASAFKENTKLSGKTLKGTLNSMKVGASQQFTTSF